MELFFWISFLNFNLKRIGKNPATKLNLKTFLTLKVVKTIIVHFFFFVDEIFQKYYNFYKKNK
jgi:hypothetical protein